MNHGKRPYSMALRAAGAGATRARIRQAAIELHAERLWNDFTLHEVAQRAGTTVQTVLRVFGSKDALATLAVEASSARRRADSPPGDIAAAIRALYDDYERIGDQVIRYLADEPRHRVLAQQVELGRRSHRRWIKTVFGPQLRTRAGRERQRLLHALVVVTDVYTWKVLRRDLHVGRRAAEDLAGAMISAVVQRGDNGPISVGVLGRGRESSAEPGHRGRASLARS